MSSYQYSKSHCGDKTVLQPSYLHNGISYTGKMTSLYWIGPSFWHQCRNIWQCYPPVQETAALYRQQQVIPCNNGPITALDNSPKSMSTLSLRATAFRICCINHSLAATSDPDNPSHRHTLDRPALACQVLIWKWWGTLGWQVQACSEL